MNLLKAAMRTTAVCLTLLLSSMQAAEPNAAADAWLAKTKIAPPLEVPASLDAWQRQRIEIRTKLNELLGDLPPRPPISAFQLLGPRGLYTFCGQRCARCPPACPPVVGLASVGGMLQQG